jgi:PAS domain S-box-containing protein
VRAPTVAPTGHERIFGEDEIIVSKTDPKGIIRYANDVFLRVSAYNEADVVGHPHNVIRHPDMPRCVFKLLWETIAGGNELFAYVLNLASDGAHYWVFAHVTPTSDRSGRIIGYHSNRRLPDRASVNAIEPLYRSLLAEEKRHAHPVAAMDASTALLQRTLDGKGMTYDELVWDITTRQGALR